MKYLFFSLICCALSLQATTPPKFHASDFTYECQEARNFLGRYAIRCAPTNGPIQDYSITTSPIRLHSINPSGTINCYEHREPLPVYFNDHNWRDVTPGEAPIAFFKNKCFELTNGNEKRFCLQQLDLLENCFFPNWVPPLSNEDPLEDLKDQCYYIKDLTKQSIALKIAEYLQSVLFQH